MEQPQKTLPFIGRVLGMRMVVQGTGRGGIWTETSKIPEFSPIPEGEGSPSTTMTPPPQIPSTTICSGQKGQYIKRQAVGQAFRDGQTSNGCQLVKQKAVGRAASEGQCC